MMTEKIENILSEKELLQEKLIKILMASSLKKDVLDAAEALAFNFRSRLIVDSLVDKMKEYDIVTMPGGLVHYASECPTHYLEPHFLFWVDIITEGSFQAALNAHGILSSFDDPEINEDDVSAAEKKLNAYKDRVDAQKSRIVKDVLRMFD